MRQKPLTPRRKREFFPRSSGNFRSAPGKCEFHGTIYAGEENLDVFRTKMTANGSNPTLAVLVVASRDDNHLRLQLPKNVQVGRLAICRQTEADKVRFQIRLPIEEFFLTLAIQVGEEKDFQPVKLAEKH